MKINKYLVIILILLSCKKAANLANTNTNQNNGNPLVTDTIGHSIQLWGMTLDALNDSGKIFKINGDGSGYSNEFSFSKATGYITHSSLCKAPNGKLYGMTEGGGISDAGTIFSFDPATNNFKKIADIPNFTAQGFSASANLSGFCLANDNNLYGTTFGSLFKIDPVNDNVTTLYNFPVPLQPAGDYLAGPFGGNLIQGKDNKLYGLLSGGVPLGGIFSFDLLTNNLTVIHTFINSPEYFPRGSLYQATDNNFYGFCSSDSGYLFKINSTGSDYSVLVKFNGVNGESPGINCGLVQGNGSKLYGLTSFGGQNIGGVLFSYDIASNVYNIEHLFGGDLGQNSLDGSFPEGGLMKASNNLLYGTTFEGGGYASNFSEGGTIFRFDPQNSSYKVIYSFPIGITGSPYGNLIEY